VNAPRTFSWTWPMVKSMLDPKTVQKIQIFSGGHEQTEALRALVDPEHLPNFLGGTCTCGDASCLCSDKGPWQDPDIVAQMESTPHLNLWEHFAPKERPAKAKQEAPIAALVPSGIDHREKHSQSPCPAANEHSDPPPPQSQLTVKAPREFNSPQVVFELDHQEKEQPRLGKLRAPRTSGSVFQKKQRILEDAYARIVKDALARVPRKQQHSWRLRVKKYFDSLVALHRSKAVTDDLAVRFHEVMDEHAQLKQELARAETELMSSSPVNDLPHQALSSSESIHEKAKAAEDLLHKFAQLDGLTKLVMASQAQRDRLHFEFKIELEAMSQARFNMLRTRLPGSQYAGCCCSPLSAKAKAYMQMQAALADAAEDLALPPTGCASPIKIGSCASPMKIGHALSPEVAPNMIDIECYSEERSCICPSEERSCLSCIDDIGTLSELASFYSVPNMIDVECYSEERSCVCPSEERSCVSCIDDLGTLSELTSVYSCDEGEP